MLLQQLGSITVIVVIASLQYSSKIRGQNGVHSQQNTTPCTPSSITRSLQHAPLLGLLCSWSYISAGQKHASEKWLSIKRGNFFLKKTCSCRQTHYLPTLTLLEALFWGKSRLELVVVTHKHVDRAVGWCITLKNFIILGSYELAHLTITTYQLYHQFS
jgi:hypothetical protein